MGRIRVMSEALANQIAAGEVVERPASCVKELMENSFDAGARHVLVAVEDGGIQSIVVQDDGCGMDEEDAVLAFARHATSKLLHPRDLFSITTLGFRGEALASIAAVSRVVLCTRMHGAERGVEVRVEGTDQVTGPRPVGMPPGTRIEVRDLFFNTPARLKYLRTVATEQGRVLDVVQRLALGRPEVAVVCDANGRRMFQTAGRGERLEVLAAMYGSAEAEQFLAIRAESPDYRVTGFIGRPAQARSSRGHGYLYVNGRSIRSPGLHQAVVAGYGSRLMVGRHPVYAIAVEMDPRLVDVNIHPHKSEVRFSEERDLAALVARAVGSALEQVALTVTLPWRAGVRRGSGGVQEVLPLHPAAPHTGKPPAPRQGAVDEPDTRRGELPHAPSSRANPAPGRPRSVPAAAIDMLYGADVVREERHALDAPAAADAPGAPQAHGISGPQGAPGARETTTVREAAPVIGGSPAVGEASGAAPASGAARGRRGALPGPLRLVGQALGSYIVAEDGENLYIIDQHAAHERVLYERFSERLESRDVRRVRLLTPLTLELAASDQARLLEHSAELDAIGLELEEFGGGLLVRTIPDVWEGLDATGLVEALAEELSRPMQDADVRSVLAERIATLACKAAVKANRRLAEPELSALLEALSELADPFHCPHGRPVMIQFSNRDLEKGFRRIV